MTKSQNILIGNGWPSITLFFLFFLFPLFCGGEEKGKNTSFDRSFVNGWYYSLTFAAAFEFQQRNRGKLLKSPQNYMCRWLIAHAKRHSHRVSLIWLMRNIALSKRPRSNELDRLLSRITITIWTELPSDVHLLSYLAHKSNKCFAVSHTWSYKPRGDHVIGKCHSVLRISGVRKETFAQQVTWTLFSPKINDVKIHLIYNSFMNSKVKMLDKVLDWPNLNGPFAAGVTWPYFS